MLLNVGLSEGFWAKEMTYVCHLVNQLPSAAIGGKTLFEVQFGKLANDYGSSHVFGSIAYYHVNESKQDPRAKKTLFMGISSRVKGCRLWYLISKKKIVFSSDIIFNEFVMLKKVTYSNSKDQKKTSGVQQQTESTSKQVEFVKTISKPISLDS